MVAPEPGIHLLWRAMCMHGCSVGGFLWAWGRRRLCVAQRVVSALGMMQALGVPGMLRATFSPPLYGNRCESVTRACVQA